LRWATKGEKKKRVGTKSFEGKGDWGGGTLDGK